MRRRRLLRAAVPGLVAFGAGCSDQESEPRGQHLFSIQVTNFEETAASLTLTVLEFGETVFESQRSVSGTDTIWIAHPVDTRGMYTIGASLSDQTVSEEISQFADETQTCVRIILRIGETGQLKIDGVGYDRCPFEDAS